jgi:hypothetical protein
MLIAAEAQNPEIRVEHPPIMLWLRTAAVAEKKTLDKVNW